jgi:hypothetical protein
LKWSNRRPEIGTGQPGFQVVPRIPVASAGGIGEMRPAKRVRAATASAGVGEGEAGGCGDGAIEPLADGVGDGGSAALDGVQAASSAATTTAPTDRIGIILRTFVSECDTDAPQDRAGGRAVPPLTSGSRR